MNISLEILVEEVAAEVKLLMDHNGLQAISDFSVKVKSLNNPTHLACYRGSTVFMSRAIFWVNENFYEIVDQQQSALDETEKNKIRRLELWKTLCHEVGHAVADMLRFMVRADQSADKENIRVRNWIGENEEDFAEDFIYYLQFNQVVSQSFYPYFEKRIKELQR